MSYNEELSRGLEVLDTQRHQRDAHRDVMPLTLHNLLRPAERTAN
jgi:hypothetical protein